MPIDRNLIVGAGGHGKVVLDAFLSSGPAPESVFVVDDDPRRIGSLHMGISVLGPLRNTVRAGDLVHVAIGDNQIRMRISELVRAAEAACLTVIHPKASVSRFATCGGGVFVAAQAVVAPSARLGDGCIVNHGAVVDHDCEVGPFAHIAPTASLGGNVRVGARTLIGAGANILPGLTIGADVTIGAGSVVVCDVAPGSLYVGVPARQRVRPTVELA